MPIGAARTVCVPASDATYRHTFNGPAGTATVTAVRPLCSGQSQTFSLASYTAPAPSQPGGLFVYAAVHATINPTHRSVTLKVAVPGCSTQVYAFFGSQVSNESTTSAALYGSSRLGAANSRSVGKFAWYAGGETACTASPTATFTSACDDTFHAALSNRPNANADAVFIRSGALTRVAPGRTVHISAKKGATLTLRASNFTTYIGGWRQPSLPCAALPQPNPAAAAPKPATPAAAAQGRSTTASAPAAFSAPTDDNLDAFPDGQQFAPNPTTAAASATTAAAGMSPGSLLAIALGFVLMGCGVVLLRRVIRSGRNPS
ncbi:hypothetical protein HH310_17820 [Actinoplanes sp. TBRC 11911]|uniref:hypothetical protein n=1 Tax=Actinoplanes sp. TBRC 11911 TaxID=2729386 RepID=UPI00145CA71C|nr:hypothetical protein [Actinoplanes sp. TBRC 11911]NMO53040.1 hypothetical protein [Actinoplanes sp. TBRC 11911]